METAKNDKNEIMVNCVNKKLVAAIKKLKLEIQRRIEHERELQKASQPSAKALVSAIIFKDSEGNTQTVLQVKTYVSPRFLERCLNNQCLWELDESAYPTENGLCRALANMKRDKGYEMNDIYNINDFETVVSNA